RAVGRGGARRRLRARRARAAHRPRPARGARRGGGDGGVVPGRRRDAARARARPAAARADRAGRRARGPGRRHAPLRRGRPRLLGAVPGPPRGAPSPRARRHQRLRARRTSVTAANPAVAPDATSLGADARTNAAWHARFTRAEIQELLRVSSARGWLSIALNWGLIAAAFALVALWPNPLTVIVALFVIGARQLGCAILMHEASH